MGLFSAFVVMLLICLLKVILVLELSPEKSVVKYLGAGLNWYWGRCFGYNF